MKKMRLVLLCFSLVFSTLFFSQCSNDNVTSQTEEDDNIVVNLDFQTGRSWSIESYHVVATKSDGTVKTTSSSKNSLSLTLKKGFWTFVVTGIDSEGTEIFRGIKENVDLSSGTVSKLTVTIVKMAGSAKIDASDIIANNPSASQIVVCASRSSFDYQEIVVNSINPIAVFSELAQGQWTFTISALISGTRKTLDTKTGKVVASALISVDFPVVTTTTTTTVTTPDNDTTYYWTNKDGHFGSNKTISNWSDWTTAEQIAQCAAYDDPRTWRGHHEVPYDVYAMYAAYDDTNLYLMVELVNMADSRAPFMGHDYAGSDNANWDNRDIPLGFIINTGMHANAPKGPSLANGDVIWGAIDFTDNAGFDWLFYGSSKYGTNDDSGAFIGVGTPGLFHAGNDGFFSYEPEYCYSVNSKTTTGTSGMSIRFKHTCAVSSTIYYENTPNDNRNTSSQDGVALMESTSYASTTTNSLDMSYWYTIPLSTLGITKSYIQNNGIGVRQLTTNGGSLMDCCPWDVSMVDVAATACPDDESTSGEKSDVDNITSRQARIGK